MGQRERARSIRRQAGLGEDGAAAGSEATPPGANPEMAKLFDMQLPDPDGYY
jgi:hypothetical protein